jgi:predicted transcriptional regulator
MSDTEEVDRLYNTLFELSNDVRHSILLLILKRPIRMTNIAKKLNLTSPEVSRHLSRLSESKLIRKDLDNFYHLTGYGYQVLDLINDLEFRTKNRDYFVYHNVVNIPPAFQKRLSELAEFKFEKNFMGFLSFINERIKESQEYIWLCIDQYPITAIESILKSVENGVKIRIIEQRDLSGPNIAFDQKNLIYVGEESPDVEIKVHNNTDVYLFVSDSGSAVAFPTEKGFDYSGFVIKGHESSRWSLDLFNLYWSNAELKSSIPITQYKLSHQKKGNVITIRARRDPVLNYHAIQNAVDNYKEVILKGTFNIGTSMIQINKNVIIRGEGKEKDIPTTILFKKGWTFPFTQWDSIFRVDDEDAEVTIENLQFTDFNHICIWGVQAKTLNIKNNRITLMTGHGRGMRFGAFGDYVVAINIWPDPGIFKGKVLIEGNYIDFARRGAHGGFLTRGGLEEDPEYRPDLFNHEYYMGFGIGVQQASGDVTIENNIIRNTNARGIAVTGNLPSSYVQIRKNIIVSDLYGSYPLSSHEACTGILAQSAWGFPSPGFNVDITENTIKLDRLNHSGIKILGPVIDRDDSGKLRDGLIENNEIYLKNGYEGIHIRKSDDFKIRLNKISGKAYYGIIISGRKKTGLLDLSAVNNIVENNDMNNLEIKEPDDYSDNHADGRMFIKGEGGSNTAHVWLEKNTNSNTVQIGEKETIVNEGIENHIIRS